MRSRRVRLFIKPWCPWCQRAMRWLEERGVAYEQIDVTGDDAAYAEMTRLSNQELTPVIEVDGEILADFGPDELAAYWKRLEKKDADTTRH